MPDHPNKQIQYINPTYLEPNPLQPRGVINPETITDLVDSIKEHGVIEPLVVAHTPAGYQIIAGERRWRASKLAGLKQVPCIIEEVSPQKMLEMAIVENVQREDLNPVERAKAFQRLMHEFSLTHAEVGKKVSKSPAYVSNSLRLLNLPDALKDGLLSGMISEGHARALMGIKDKSLMIEAYKIVLRESASVRRTEEIVRRIKERVNQLQGENQELVHHQKQSINHEKLDKMQADILSSLGKKSNVKLIQSDRQTKITITLRGTPEENEERLDRIYSGLTN